MTETITDNPLTFYQVLMRCAVEPELIANYDRLNGTNLSLKGSRLDRMIDESTGRLDSELAGFIEFVYDCVWLRLPREAIGAIPPDPSCGDE